MKKIIKLIATRKGHKPLAIDYFNTPFGREALEKNKENLERRGYSVTVK